MPIGGLFLGHIQSLSGSVGWSPMLPSQSSHRRFAVHMWRAPSAAQCIRTIPAPVRGMPRRDTGIEVIGTAPNARTARHMIRELNPDVMSNHGVEAACARPSQGNAERPACARGCRPVRHVQALANQILWIGPLPFSRARTRTSSTANPACFSRRVNPASGSVDQMARMPPGLSAASALASPRVE